MADTTVETKAPVVGAIGVIVRTARPRSTSPSGSATEDHQALTRFAAVNGVKIAELLAPVRQRARCRAREFCGQLDEDAYCRPTLGGAHAPLARVRPRQCGRLEVRRSVRWLRVLSGSGRLGDRWPSRLQPCRVLLFVVGPAPARQWSPLYPWVGRRPGGFDLQVTVRVRPAMFQAARSVGPLSVRVVSRSADAVGDRVECFGPR